MRKGSVGMPDGAVGDEFAVMHAHVAAHKQWCAVGAGHRMPRCAVESQHAAGSGNSRCGLEITAADDQIAIEYFIGVNRGLVVGRWVVTRQECPGVSVIGDGSTESR